MSLKDVLTKQADLLRAKTGDTEKLSLSRMRDLINTLQWGQYNMIDGTSDQYKTIHTNQTTGSSNMVSMDGFHGGNIFTYSATITGVTEGRVVLDVLQCDKKGNSLDATKYPAELVSTDSVGVNEEADISVNIRITVATWYLSLHFTTINTSDGVQPIQVKNERLYTGSLPGVWRPSLNDIIRGGRIKLMLLYLQSNFNNWRYAI